VGFGYEGGAGFWCEPHRDWDRIQASKRPRATGSAWTARLCWRAPAEPVCYWAHWRVSVVWEGPSFLNPQTLSVLRTWFLRAVGEEVSENSQIQKVSVDGEMNLSGVPER
jgi:hypothetical protein